MTDKLFLDIECYPNYFLVKLMNDEGRFREFEMYEGQGLDVVKLRALLNSYTVVTFNGANYDWPILSLALNGADNEQLKEASDAIIVNDMKPWNFYKHFRCQALSYDHIDIKEVAPGVMVSLKLYAGRLHAPKMQDLPYDPDSLLTREQMQAVNLYCGNDLHVTKQLYDAIKGRVTLRETMSAEYRTDLRSKSDAQVAEAVIKTELFRLTSKKLAKPSVKEKQFFYKVPEYMKFESDQLNNVFEMVKRSPFTAKTNGQIEMTEELANTLIHINGSTYKLGIGGLHSQESEVSHLADDEYMIVDRDVTSYYPSIILNQGLYPETLGPHLLEVFKVLVDRRVAAKRKNRELKKLGVKGHVHRSSIEKANGLVHFNSLAKEEIADGASYKEYLSRVTLEQDIEFDRSVTVMDSLRITINGAFGKLGSVYSALYAPDLMIQVTVTGQLTLLMLIERFEMAGIKVISANTDGIVTRYQRSRHEEVAAIVKQFEQETMFEFEDTHYSGLYSRDVNNYIAIKPDGEVKTKGTFKAGDLQKNTQNDICNEALIAYLKNGTPIEETIRACKDIRKFVTVRTVKGGGVWNFDGEYLGKVVRWYYATGSEVGTINYIKSGNKVPRTDGCIPLMDLPIDFPNNVDYNFYINEVNDLLMDVGLVARPPVVKKTRSKKT
jgi:DNA polymerase elongation subunit (family B)